jgi:ferrochelatase
VTPSSAPAREVATAGPPAEAPAPAGAKAGRIGVLLTNLGTPAAPTTTAVRRYLAEFLWDRRVVEVPRLLWWLILRGVILPFRSSRSAAKYATVWTPEGSPLMAISRRQRSALEAVLRARGLDLEVGLAMRYGEPSIAGAWDGMRRAGVGRLLLVPLYPQYSATTIASTFDALAQALAGERNQPGLRTVRGYCADPGYIASLAASVRAHWALRGAPDRLVISFHGLPRRNLDLGDPYFHECQETARLLGAELGLAAGSFDVTFQSRFGRAAWLEPYTVEVLRSLGARGVGRVDVLCPGFAADCLETLEEIAVEGRQELLSHGGKELCLIPCLNDTPGFIEALADLVARNLQGWT